MKAGSCWKVPLPQPLGGRGTELPVLLLTNCGEPGKMPYLGLQFLFYKVRWLNHFLLWVYAREWDCWNTW